MYIDKINRQPFFMAWVAGLLVAVAGYGLCKTFAE